MEDSFDPWEGRDLIRSLAENSDRYAILFLNQEARIVTWSSLASRLLGVAEEEARGEHLSRMTEQNNHDLVFEALIHAAAFGNWHGEVSSRGSEGLSLSITALRQSPSEHQGFAVIFQEVCLGGRSPGPSGQHNAVNSSFTTGQRETERAIEALCTSGGGWADFDIPAKPAKEVNGSTTIDAGVFSTANHLKQIEQALHIERERVRSTLQLVADGVAITDSQARIEYLNPAFERLIGWSGADARGLALMRVLEMENDTTEEPIECPATFCLRESRALCGMSCRIKNGNDQPSVMTSCAPIRLESGMVVGSVVVCHDITRTVELLSEVEYQATHDELTGLVNRRELERQLQCALEHGADSALLLMDLAHLKVINDTCGHAAGDELLRQLADIFSKHTGAYGTAARIGGDEFAILLEDSTLEEALGVAEGLRTAVRDFRFWYLDRPLGIGINIGAAPFESADQDAAEVMRRAEHACFFAKTHGPNSVYVHQPGDKAIAQRRSTMAWASRLSDAIRLNSLELYHQPIIPADTHSSDKTHCEILVRMRSPDGTLIKPSRFYQQRSATASCRNWTDGSSVMPLCG